MTVTASGCTSAPSAPTVVTVNPTPPTPTITPGGPTTFCAGGSVTLTSNSATGNQWYLNGNPLGGATNQTYVATAAGNYTVVVTTSGCNSAPSAPITVTINPAPTITPGGSVGFCAGGSVTLTSSSATGNQWYLNGNPIGGATNQTYVATTAGSYTVVVTANGCSSGPSAATTLTVTAITVNPNTLPGGTIGTGYSQSVSASPAGTYTFAVTSGALPTGLTLNASTGAITGTPTAAGTFSFRVTASNGTCSGFRDYTVTIVCPTITLGTLANGTAGTAYSQTISVTPAGGYTFSVLTGSLPSGLNLNTSTGGVSGTPTVPGNYNFSVQAMAASGCNATQSYSLAIACPAITLSILPTPTLNTPYNQTVTASPAGSYSFAVTGGALPTGLSLHPATGVVSGTPTAAGAYSFTITATSFGSCTGSRTYTGTIIGGGCPTITLAALPSGTVGMPYNNYPTALPVASYTYAVTAGTLPPGLTLYSFIGLLSGFPTTAGTYNFTITATDTSSCVGMRSYSITINAAFARAVINDFDGDGKSDLVIWRGKQSQWVIANSGDGQQHVVQWVETFDPESDVMACRDYDGDGKYDLAFYRRATGQWLIRSSKDGAAITEQWGIAGDVPVSADYDGDGKADLAVWRESESTWYIRRSSDGHTQTEQFGASGALFRDVPVPADYDGDRKADIAILRQGIRQGSHWYIRQSSDGAVIEKALGLSRDVPVVADYDGDGKADIAVWRGLEGIWYILRSSDESVRTIWLGAAWQGNVPAPGDYDGDGKADVAVWQGAASTLHVKQSSNGSEVSKAHGQSGDVPVVVGRN